MKEPWPPRTADMNKAFTAARDAKNDNTTQPPAQKIVTKKELQELEKQRKKPTAQLNMVPGGGTVDQTIEKQREARIKKMKERLQQKDGKARDDFNRSRDL